MNELTQKLLQILKADSTDDEQLLVKLLTAFSIICSQLDIDSLKFTQSAEEVLYRSEELIQAVSFYLPDNHTQDIDELRNRLENVSGQLLHHHKERLELQQQLNIASSDLETLQKEVAFLKQLKALSTLRAEVWEHLDELQSRQDVLSKAASRVSEKTDQLKDFADQVEILIQKQREILKSDLKKNQNDWNKVEKEIFF